MRRTLGSLILTTALAGGLLAGCGSDSASRAEDADTRSGASAAPSTPPAPDGQTTEPTTVALVSESAAGGEVDEHPTVLSGAGALEDFVQQFRREELRAELRAAVAGTRVPEDRALVGAVVSVGCDVPPGVTVHGSGDDLTVRPLKVASPQLGCFAAVTTVALVLVDADSV